MAYVSPVMQAHTTAAASHPIMVTEAEGELLRRFGALRRSAYRWAEVGVAFTLGGSRGWKRAGFLGLAEACDALALELDQVEGGRDLHVEAVALAAALRTVR